MPDEMLDDVTIDIDDMDDLFPTDESLEEEEVETPDVLRESALEGIAATPDGTAAAPPDHPTTPRTPDDVRPYRLDGHYVPGDYVSHPTWGEGEVLGNPAGPHQRIRLGRLCVESTGTAGAPMLIRVNFDGTVRSLIAGLPLQAIAAGETAGPEWTLTEGTAEDAACYLKA